MIIFERYQKFQRGEEEMGSLWSLLYPQLFKLTLFQWMVHTVLLYFPTQLQTVQLETSMITMSDKWRLTAKLSVSAISFSPYLTQVFVNTCHRYWSFCESYLLHIQRIISQGTCVVQFFFWWLWQDFTLKIPHGFSSSSLKVLKVSVFINLLLKNRFFLYVHGKEDSLKEKMLL